MVMSFLLCLFTGYNAFRLKLKLLLISAAIWVAAIVVLAVGLPILVQQTVVKPNELAKESPYIAYNIDFTRQAYNLNSIQEVDFTVDNSLDAEKIKNHQPMDCITFTTNGEEADLRKRLNASALNLTQDLYVSETLKTGRIMAKDEDVCLHCGLCAERCPTGAWDMQKFLLDMTHAGPACRPRQATPGRKAA